jgi:hypothetical protein
MGYHRERGMSQLRPIRYLNTVIKLYPVTAAF